MFEEMNKITEKFFKQSDEFIAKQKAMEDKTKEDSELTTDKNYVFIDSEPINHALNDIKLFKNSMEDKTKLEENHGCGAKYARDCNCAGRCGQKPPSTSISLPSRDKTKPEECKCGGTGKLTATDTKGSWDVACHFCGGKGTKPEGKGTMTLDNWRKRLKDFNIWFRGYDIRADDVLEKEIADILKEQADEAYERGMERVISLLDKDYAPANAIREKARQEERNRILEWAEGYWYWEDSKKTKKERYYIVKDDLISHLKS